MLSVIFGRWLDVSRVCALQPRAQMYARVCVGEYVCVYIIYIYINIYIYIYH